MIALVLFVVWFSIGVGKSSRFSVKVMGERPVFVTEVRTFASASVPVLTVPRHVTE